MRVSDGYFHYVWGIANPTMMFALKLCYCCRPDWPDVAIDPAVA